jgi:hypothetical protein
MLDLATARILTISQTEQDSQEIKTFMARMPFDNLTARDFVVGKLVPTDDYDFAIFDASKLPRIQKDTVLKHEDEAHLQLFRAYLKKPVRYILFYGEFLHDLDRERCPSANSKFTLFARIRELIDFINHYKNQ